jgi:hypothetical protein
MGMNYSMRYPIEDDIDLYRKIDKEVRTWLHRGYSAFICDPEGAGDICEFHQIEKLYNIDLSPLRCYNYGGLGMYEENVEGELDWKLENAESDAEKEELKKIYAIKLEEAKLEDKEDFENNWIATSIVKSTILSLFEKIQKQPELLEQIEYSRYFDKYSFNMSDNHDNYSYKEVFEQILKFIDVIESHGMYKMAFYEH